MTVLGSACEAAAASQGGPEEPPTPAAACPKLDEGSFRHFRPLLAACQEYAVYSGCRFRSESFDDIPDAAASASSSGSPDRAVGPKRSRDPGPRLASKLHAAPVVREFAARLSKGDDAALNEELERAHRIVMTESVRNAIRGMLKALDMFPPDPPPPGIAEDDCAYEDVTAPLPVIGQRLYNDEVRRLSDGTESRPYGRLEHRAATASFLVDFAEGVGAPLPPVPETQREMLRELATRVSEARDATGASGLKPERREAFLRGLGVGAVANSLREEAQKYWTEMGGWQAVLWTAAGAAAVGVAAVASAALMKRDGDKRDDERRDDSPR